MRRRQESASLTIYLWSQTCSGEVCRVGGAAVSHSASGRLHATCLSAPRSCGAPESVNQPSRIGREFVLKLFCHFPYVVCQEAKQNELFFQD